MSDRPTEARVSDERLLQFIKDMSFGTDSTLPYFQDVRKLLCELESLRRAPEPAANPLSYNEVERISQRIYQFGKDNNPVSRDCELQALRIRLGWTGAFATSPPTKAAGDK